MIVKMLESGGFGCNTYIVGSEQTKEAMIIDPGGDGPFILETLQKLGLKAKLIVVTHGHPDHIGALKEVKDATGAEVRTAATDTKALQWLVDVSRTKFDANVSMPPTGGTILKGGETIELGELKFDVIHTPGHNPGEICLIGHGIAFVGDVLFAGSIGRYDFPNGDLDALMNSIHTKLMTLPDETIVAPGHGPTTTIGRERKTNPFVTGEAF